MLEARAVLLRTSVPIASSPWMSWTATVLGPAQPLPGKRLSLVPSIICTSDPDTFALDLPSPTPSLAETLKGVRGQFKPSLNQTPLYLGQGNLIHCDRSKIFLPTFPAGFPEQA